jgi:threonyl-tRNA synthetase
VQAVVATIVSDANDYGEEVAAELGKAGLRVETDLRNEKINYKVREHSLAKVPNLLVLGKRERRSGRWRFARSAPKPAGGARLDALVEG